MERERLTILVVTGRKTGIHCFRSQIGSGSSWDCLLGESGTIFCISESLASRKQVENRRRLAELRKGHESADQKSWND